MSVFQILLLHFLLLDVMKELLAYPKQLMHQKGSQ